VKRILVITAFSPSTYSAGQNYTRQAIEYLCGFSKVDLVYFSYQNQGYEFANPNFRLLDCIHFNFLHKLINMIFCIPFHPILSNRFSWFTLVRLKKISRQNQYDLIYFDFSQVFIYSLFFNNKKVLMTHDLMIQKFSRQGTWFEKIWLRFNESILFKTDAQILCFSLKDKTIIKKNYNRDSFIVPFFISDQLMENEISYFPENSYFVFFGAWNRKENSDGLRWFIEHLSELLTVHDFIIIGGGMPSDLIRLIASYSKIKYLGFVQNPYPIIARSKALIAPLHKGAGVKVKAIEALACGTSVIGTSVALEGIDFEFEKALIHCELSQEFFETISAFTISLEEKIEIRNAFLNMYKLKRERLKEFIINLS